jgi:ribosomal protein L32
VLAIAGDSCLDLDSYEDTREFCDEINDLPPVTPPHPKMGHWISLDTGKPSHLKDGMTTEGVKCSECGEWLIASDEYACYGKYCPNCGSYNGGGE